MSALAVLALGFQVASGQVAVDNPAYPAPFYEIFEVEGFGRVPVRLLGISIEQQGQEHTARLPRLSPTPLRITAVWEANVEMASTIKGAIRFNDSTFLLERTFDIRIGPESREEPWHPGSQYAQTYTLDLTEVADVFSGDSFMTLNLQLTGSGPSGQRAFLSMPVHVQPMVRERSESTKRLANFLSGELTILPVQTRLGLNAQAKLDVPPGNSEESPPRTLAVLSSLSYQAPPQGELVCNIEVQHHSGAVTHLKMLSGRDTARCDHDAYPPGRLNHERAHIYTSRDSPQPGPQGRPVELHVFISTWQLPKDAGPVESVKVKCMTETVCDIAGIILTDGQAHFP